MPSELRNTCRFFAIIAAKRLIQIKRTIRFNNQKRECDTMISERDWKLFRKRLPEWQERHMQALLDEYVAIIAGDGNPSTKFWKLEGRLKKDVRHVGEIGRAHV